jgi:hypothetical protein
MSRVRSLLIVAGCSGSRSHRYGPSTGNHELFPRERELMEAGVSYNKERLHKGRTGTFAI